MNRDYKISIIRILAMCAIVMCHIFQAKDIAIAFWLNVGVQVFLFMSGFLYGKKQISNSKEWLKKQFIKILVPYYIYITIIMAIYFIFARDSLNIRNVLSVFLNLQLIFAMPKGLGHLWFIPVILICYLITPILYKCINKKTKYRVIRYTLVIGMIILLQLMFLQNRIAVGVTNITCYILGYLISHFSITNKKCEKTMSISIIVLAVISNFAKIFLIQNEYNFWINVIIKILVNNSHILLGCAIFIILYKILYNVVKILKPKIVNVIDNIDKHCYYIYITHHVFILGSFSMINLTNNIILNIAIILFCIILSSDILKKISDILIKGVKKNEKSNVSFWDKTRSDKDVSVGKRVEIKK